MILSDLRDLYARVCMHSCRRGMHCDASCNVSDMVKISDEVEISDVVMISDVLNC